MKRWIVLGLLLMGGILRFAGPASAQFYPGYGYGGSGWDGSAALLGADYRQAQVIQSRTESRLAGQAAAQQQNYVVQSGIRNTLSSQAQSRDAAITAQQQATQDWWFQYQQQQMAQQPAEHATAAAPMQGWGSLAPPGPPPPASMDIIKWPTLLQAPCFAADREKIEAPYRSRPQAKWNTLSRDDFRQMSAAVEEMKALLQWRSSDGVDTNEFEAAKAFLNQMSNELAKLLQPAKT